MAGFEEESGGPKIGRRSFIRFKFTEFWKFDKTREMA